MEELINSNTSPAPYNKILELASIVRENVPPGIDIFLYNGGQFQDFTVGRWRGVAVDQLFQKEKPAFLYNQFTILI